MDPKQLILRCYGEKKGDVWQAFCLDLNLAVQGKTFQDVKGKLHQQIGSYLYDALEGEDRQYADQLLTRKAPLPFWAKYYFYKALNTAKDGASDAKDSLHKFFNEVMPMHVSTGNHAHRHA